MIHGIADSQAAVAASRRVEGEESGYPAQRLCSELRSTMASFMRFGRR